MLNLKDYLSTKRINVERELDRLFQGEKFTTIIEAMRYSLMAGGKRIRPVLCIAAAEAVGGNERDVIPAACAIEMVHTYSLIHDDLPAMDNDDLRRGHPTCHIRFNEATAILAGDGLLTLAFDMLARSGLVSDINSLKWLKVIQLLATAAGYPGMIEGQMQDMTAEGKRLTLEQLETMHCLKTGAMIETALVIGAILGNGTKSQQQDLAKFGRKIGLAFQVTDDLLNINGDPHEMGKAVGTDQSRGKNTYPALLGLAASEDLAKDLIEQALQAIALFDGKAEPLRLIARYIIDRNR
ncbi:MAG: polyprenyl synthetase family protein [Desulfobacteraceae bacterium]|jgi:geranylgeranyl diphosphate synthase type II